MNSGKYITRPAYITSKHSLMPCTFICGAAYSESGELIQASQRQHADRDIYLNDPPVLPLVHHFKTIKSSDPILYLGNHFSHYGHFVMETLPMLSYLLENKRTCFFNHLPFGRNKLLNAPDGVMINNTDFRLLEYFAKILEIEISRVFVNHQARIPQNQTLYSVFLGHDFRGNFEIIPRPTVMNDKLINKHPFDVIFNFFEKKLLGCSMNNVIKDNCSKVFLARPPKFYSKEKSIFVEKIAKDNGFIVVHPEKLTIEDQIKLMQNAREVMGFSGSQLHNVIFGRKIEKVIEIGRIKGEDVNPNQKICTQITESSLKFCPMASDDEMRDCIRSLVKS